MGSPYFGKLPYRDTGDIRILPNNGESNGKDMENLMDTVINATYHCLGMNEGTDKKMETNLLMRGLGFRV